MRTVLDHDVAGIAASLDNESLHVWLLDYAKTKQRAPLLALLGAYLGVGPDEVVLLEGMHGRPQLAPPWNQFLEFNWSHSEDKAAIVVARGVTPGVDIEHIRPRPHARQIAERFLHPEEIAALSALDEPSLNRAFLELWTGKEAVLKALGRGIAFGLHRLRLAIASSDPRLIWLDEDDASRWQLHAFDAGKDYVGRVAWRGTARTVRLETLAAEVGT